MKSIPQNRNLFDHLIFKKKKNLYFWDNSSYLKRAPWLIGQPHP